MEKSFSVSKTSRITGWVLSALVMLFCLYDAFGKFSKPEAVIKETTEPGYPENMITPIGVMLLICTVLYALPKLNLLGAVLLTGYLGGAVATQVRVESPFCTHILYPAYLGILRWFGLYIRGPNLRRQPTEPTGR